MDQSTTLIRRSGEPFVTAVGSAINRLWLADEAAVVVVRHEHVRGASALSDNHRLRLRLALGPAEILVKRKNRFSGFSRLDIERFKPVCPDRTKFLFNLRVQVADRTPVIIRQL